MLGSIVCAGGVVYPHNKKYIVESGLNAKEIEMGTTAGSLELRFRLYRYLSQWHIPVKTGKPNMSYPHEGTQFA